MGRKYSPHDHVVQGQWEYFTLIGVVSDHILIPFLISDMELGCNQMPKFNKKFLKILLKIITKGKSNSQRSNWEENLM